MYVIRYIPIIFIYSLIYLPLVGCRPSGKKVEMVTPANYLSVGSGIQPEKNMRIVLTSLISGKEPFVHNDSSISSHEFEKHLIKDALVTISHNLGTDTLAMSSPGVYISAQPLKEYTGAFTLYVKDIHSGEEFSSVTTLLPKVKFDTIYPTKKISTFDTTIYFNYEISDNVNEENWYVIRFIKKQTGQGINLDLHHYFNYGENKELTDFHLLSDESFQNGKISDIIELEVGTSDTIVAEIANITKGHFEFLRAVESHYFLIDINSEPIQIPTNIPNGYGYFYAYHPDYKLFYLKDY